MATTTTTAASGHRRSLSDVANEQHKPVVLEQQNPSAVKTYLNNLGTSVAGIALTRITGLQNYLRTPEQVKDGLNWIHTKVKNFRIFTPAEAQTLPTTAEQPVVQSAPAPQQPVAPAAEATTAAQQPVAPAAETTTAAQQPVAPAAPTAEANATADSTSGIWSGFKGKLSNAGTWGKNLGNSVVEHFSVNRGWYGRAIGFAASYHALNYAVDRFASHKIKNEYVRRAVSFAITTAAVWTVAVYVVGQEISAYDVVDTGMQVLLTTKVLEFGVPYIKAGYGRLPNAPAWISFRKAEVLKEKTA